MEKSSPLIQANLSLMENAPDLYLSTNSQEGYPLTRAMLNLRNPVQYPTLAVNYTREANPFVVYISTNTSSRKVAYLRTDPRITVYYCTPDAFHGLLLGGEVQEVTDPALKHTFWVEGWERYYPQGVDDPDYTLLRLEPVFARGWYQADNFAFDPRELK